MKKSAVLLCLLFVIGIASISAETKPWTVLVYMMGNNNLEESALTDLQEMIDQGSGKNYNVVVLAGRGSSYTQEAVGGIKAWKTVKEFYVNKGSLKELADYGAIDMGSPATIGKFLAKNIIAYPAEHYAVFFWDHGGAWTGYGQDEAFDSGFTVDQLSQGLAAGLAKAKLPKLDLLGFDACLMSAYEAISAYQKFANYYLASEELEPGHGWDYHSLAVLESNPQASAVDLGKSIIKGYQAQSKVEKDFDEVTLALLDLAQFPKLESAVHNFTKAAMGEMKTLAGDLGRSASKALAYGKTGKPEEDSHMVDLGALLKTVVKSNPDLEPHQKAIQAALKNVVVAQVAGSMLKDSTGLSIYFPNRQKLYDKDYGNVGPKDWKDFLTAYFSAGTASPKSTVPKFLNKDGIGKVVNTKDDITLKGKLAKGSAPNVVDSTFYYGFKDGDRTIFIGDADGIVDDETGEVEGSWDKTYLNLKLGKIESMAYMSMSDSEDGSTLFSIPFAYYKNGKIDPDKYDYTHLDIALNDKSEIVSQTLYIESDDGKSAELKPKAGSKIVPLVEVVGEDGESTMETTNDKGFDARKWEDIDFEFPTVEKDETLALELNVWDSSDNNDYVFFEGTVK